jgi:hypothetical protein
VSAISAMIGYEPPVTGAAFLSNESVQAVICDSLHGVG